MSAYINDNAALTVTHYGVLGVSPTAELSEIKAAYKRKLLDTHPDKTFGKVQGGTDDMINRIKTAYQCLSCSESRSVYDESLKISIQKQGFNINGDGLDTYSLEDFESGEHEDIWVKDCPRCTFPRSITLTECDLEQSGTDDGQGGYEIIVQCESCSLWIKVKYYAAEDDDEQ